VPLAGNFVPNGVKAAGLGDIETGVKYRFVDETDHRPQIGVFPFLELPTGSAARGLGNGQVWARLPLWIQKSFGPWTTYGGGGAVVNEAPGQRTYPIAGWLLQRDIGKKLTLGGEVFTHGGEGPQSLSPRYSVMLDFGGYYYFTPDHRFQLLFAGGHSVSGQSETYAYLGLYWTWGAKQKGASSAPLQSRFDNNESGPRP